MENKIKTLILLFFNIFGLLYNNKTYQQTFTSSSVDLVYTNIEVSTSKVLPGNYQK